MNFKKAKSLALAAAVLCTFSAAEVTEAASAKDQVSFLAGQAKVWGADSFYSDWQKDKGCCAVTDLDGNGRLELFFLRYVRNPVPGANDKGSNEEQGRALVATVPITMRVCGFEVSADGKKLEELKFNYPDKIIPPNLNQSQEGFYKTDDKARFYNVATLNRVGDLGFCLYRQVVSLKNGTVTVQTLATEHGNYGLFNEYPTAEAIFDYGEDRYGKQLNEPEYNEYVKTLKAGTVPTDVKIGWIYSYNWEKAQTAPGGVRKVFEESWSKFRFAKKDAVKKEIKKKKDVTKK